MEYLLVSDSMRFWTLLHRDRHSIKCQIQINDDDFVLRLIINISVDIRSELSQLYIRYKMLRENDNYNTEATHQRTDFYIGNETLFSEYGY